MTRACAATRHVPGALFVASTVIGERCSVLASAAAIANLGAVGLVLCLVPGALWARVVVMPLS